MLFIHELDILYFAVIDKKNKNEEIKLLAFSETEGSLHSIFLKATSFGDNLGKIIRFDPLGAGVLAIYCELEGQGQIFIFRDYLIEGIYSKIFRVNLKSVVKTADFLVFESERIAILCQSGTIEFQENGDYCYLLDFCFELPVANENEIFDNLSYFNPS